MIGSIKNLNFEQRSGFIMAEDGKSIYFAASAVWDCDYSSLTIGQVVSFDLLDGQWRKAVNIHPGGWHATHARKKPQGPAEVRFVGFDETNGVRTFRFQVVICNNEIREFAVRADRTMFGKHHVAIQDGPALCFRLLATELAAGHPEHSQLVLTEKHFLAHVGSIPIPKPRRHRRVRPGVRVLG